MSEHTRLLAEALAAAGDRVEVWAPPASSAGGAAPEARGVTVHALPSRFGLDALRVLRAALRALPAGTRVLVQYAPAGYGMRTMNLPFALLLWEQQRGGIELYFHDLGFPISRRERVGRNLGGLAHLVMAWLALRAARRVFVALPEWQSRLRRLGVRPRDPERVVTWVPVPSVVAGRADPSRVGEIRRTLLTESRRYLVGHVNSTRDLAAALVVPAVERILDEGDDRVVLLIGQDSEQLRDTLLRTRPDLVPRLAVTGDVAPEEASASIAACDLLVQPYEEGASVRHRSLLAGLALGRPIVTNRGASTEAIWAQRHPVALTASADAATLALAAGTLLGDVEQRVVLGVAAELLYSELFAVERAVARLRGAELQTAPSPDEASLVASELAPPTPAAVPRVLMVHATLPRRGRARSAAEDAVHRLANALVALGTPVTVASLTAAPEGARYLHRRLYPGQRWLYATRLGRLLVLPALLNRMRLDDIDVVHFHGDDGLVLRRPRPTVRTLHGSARRALQHASPLRRLLGRFVLHPLERSAARLATTAVAVNEDTALQHGIGRVIGNGVDHDVFRPGPRSDAPRILFVGSLDGGDRGRWLYELFVRHIAPVRPDVQLHLVADVAPPAHPQVSYQHLPDDTELARTYREAWLCALPSSYEGFGMRYLEAMASGTAVLATPNPGALELLGNGRFGVMADDAMFGDAMLRLLRDHDARERIAAAGWQRSRELSWRQVGEAYLGVYADARQRFEREDTIPAAGESASRELLPLRAAPRRVRGGIFRGLVLHGAGLSPLQWWRALRPDAPHRALRQLARDAASVVDVGAGDGAAMLYALARPSVRRVLAFEPDEPRREAIRELLAPNGVATDPRLTLSRLAIGDGQRGSAAEETATLDEQISELCWPLLVRVSAPAALGAALAGATRLMAQAETRWLVAVRSADASRFAAVFSQAGYRVRLLRGRGRDTLWIAATRPLPRQER